MSRRTRREARKRRRGALEGEPSYEEEKLFYHGSERCRAIVGELGVGPLDGVLARLRKLVRRA